MIILTLQMLQMSSTFTYLSQQHLPYLAFCLLLSTAVTSDSSCPRKPNYCKSENFISLTTLFYTFKEPDLSTSALNSETPPGKPVDIRWSRVDYRVKSACAPVFNLTWRLPNPGNFTTGFRLNFTYVFKRFTAKSYILNYTNPAGIADYSRAIFYYDCLWLDDSVQNYLVDLQSLSPNELLSSSCRANHKFLSFTYPIRGGSVRCSWAMHNSSYSLKPFTGVSCIEQDDKVNCSGHWKAYANIFSSGSCVDVIFTPGPECLKFTSYTIYLREAVGGHRDVKDQMVRTADINDTVHCQLQDVSDGTNTVHCQFLDVSDGTYLIMIHVTSDFQQYQCLVDGSLAKCDLTVLGPFTVSASANCEKCRLINPPATTIMSIPDQEITSETLSVNTADLEFSSSKLFTQTTILYLIICLTASISVVVVTVSLAVRRRHIKQPASQVLLHRKPKILLATFVSCEKLYEIIKPFEELLKCHFDCNVVRGTVVDESVDHVILIPPEPTPLLNFGGQPDSLWSDYVTMPADSIFYRFLTNCDVNDTSYQLHIVCFECSQSHFFNQPLAYSQQTGRLYILVKDIHRLLIDIFGHETVSSVDYSNCCEHQQMLHALQCNEDSDVVSVGTDDIYYAIHELNIEYDLSCRTAA